MAKKKNSPVNGSKINEPRINGEIVGYDTVRVVYSDSDGNNTNMVCSLRAAFEIADREGLDLIEISPNANPPVVKVADYSKHLYDLKKREKLKRQNRTELKEISLSVNISMHDLEIKAKKAKEFIEKGDKVKVSLMMRKRELLRREENKKSILEFILLLEDVAVPESMPKDEGNRTIVILKKR